MITSFRPSGFQTVWQSGKKESEAIPSAHHVHRTTGMSDHAGGSGAEKEVLHPRPVRRDHDAVDPVLFGIVDDRLPGMPLDHDCISWNSTILSDVL